MANYTQSVLFAPKDGLDTGHAAKVIKGTEIDAELGAIATAIASKENSASKGAASGYAPLDASTFVPVANLPVVTVAKGGTGRSTLTANNLLAGNTAGTVNLIAPGVAGQVLRSTGTAFASAALIAADIPALDAAKITTGAFADARIPALAAGKITTGTFADARIPSLAATKITSGTLADARLSSNVPLKNAANVFSAAQQVTTVELGHATDTTVARLAAGKLGVEGKAVAKHAGAYTSAEITISTLAPSESGAANGDLWLKV